MWALGVAGNGLNGIGDAWAAALGEALTTYSAVTSINLSGKCGAARGRWRVLERAAVRHAARRAGGASLSGYVDIMCVACRRSIVAELV